MRNTKIDSDLADRLKNAAKRQMTAEEIYNQTVSYVYGNLPEDSGITKEHVAALVRRNAGIVLE